jgi:hypothetical protein
LFITFLRRLIKDTRQKVFLVVDNLKVHHTRKVKAWVQSHRHEIELFDLPAYAPESNPDEYLNNDVKQKLRQKPQPASKDALVANTRTVMRAIQRSPARVRSYFRPGPVHHAHAALFQRHVDPGIMLHGCPSRMLGADPFGPRSHHHPEGQPPTRHASAQAHYGI